MTFEARILPAVASALCLGLAAIAAARRPNLKGGLFEGAVIAIATIAAALSSNAFQFLLAVTCALGLVIVRYWKFTTTSTRVGLAGQLGCLVIVALDFDFAPHATAAAGLLFILLQKKFIPVGGYDSLRRLHPLPRLALSNSHFGGLFLLLYGASRVDAAVPEIAHFASNVGIVAAVAMACVGLLTSDPTRIGRLLTLSQGAFILAGLDSESSSARRGALVLWLVAIVGTSLLSFVHRSLEARAGVVTSEDGRLPADRPLGFGISAPRLAVFHLIAVLALVGFPGTLGFVGEDLLLHGVIAEHPLIGIGLPVATALSAVNALRMHSRLFWGPRSIAPSTGDARPHESFGMLVFTLFLVVGGLLPGLVIGQRTLAAGKTFESGSSARVASAQDR